MSLNAVGRVDKSEGSVGGWVLEEDCDLSFGGIGKLSRQSGHSKLWKLVYLVFEVILNVGRSIGAICDGYLSADYSIVGLDEMNFTI